MEEKTTVKDIVLKKMKEENITSIEDERIIEAYRKTMYSTPIILNYDDRQCIFCKHTMNKMCNYCWYCGQRIKE